MGDQRVALTCLTGRFASQGLRSRKSSQWELGILAVTGIGIRMERNRLWVYGHSHADTLHSVAVVILAAQGRYQLEPFRGWSSPRIEWRSTPCYDDSSRVDVETSGLKARHRK